MKEFRTKIGGRKIYNEDFANIQDLVEAALSFFKDCDLNYVISGCEVTDDTVEEGYVCLEGQIRKVEKTTIANSQRPVITPTTQVISQKYTDGNVSPIGTIYGTKIIPSNEYLSGAGIQSFLNGKTGKYEFEKIIDTFWNNYTLVKEGAKKQDVDVTTKFTNALKMAGVIIGRQNKSVKITSNTIYFYNNAAVSSYVRIDNAGTVSFYNKNNEVIFKFNGNGGISSETIENVVMCSLDAKVITANKLTVGKADIKDVFFTIEEYADTGWHNLVRAKSGEEIPNLFARSYMGIVHIQGTLPADTFTDLDNDEKYRPLSSGYYRTNKLLNIKLPDVIPAPSEDYINTFNVITPIYGTVGANVFLDKDTKRFYIADMYDSNLVGKLRPAEDMGLNLFSFPFYDRIVMNGEINQAILGITTTNENIAKTLEFPDKSVCPSISWQYSADVPVELYSITYADKFYFNAMFNPDSDILHVMATFVRLELEMNLKTKETHQRVAVNSTATVSGFTYTIFDNMGHDMTVRDNDVIYMADPCVRKYEGKYRGPILSDENYLSDPNFWPYSYGYKLNGLQSIERAALCEASNYIYFDKIKIDVHFKDTPWYTNHTETKIIFDRPSKFSLNIGQHIKEDIIGTTRTLVSDYFYIDTSLWEYYEYERKDSNGVKRYYSNEITNENATGNYDILHPCLFSILSGKEYIEPKEIEGAVHCYGWTDLALKAKTPFKIKVKMWLDSYLIEKKTSIYANGKNGDMEGFQKTVEITIHPDQYTLVQ